MIHLRNNYSHKFINDKFIYCITPKICYTTSKMSFYSVPYTSRETKEENALLGFSQDALCRKYVDRLQNTMDYEDVKLYQIELQEYKYISTLMKLPVVVIVDEAYDSKFEIYYYKNHGDKFHFSTTYSE